VVAGARVEELAAIGLPVARAATLRDVAALFDRGDFLATLDVGDRDQVTRRLIEVRGIGAWTAAYVVMRALHDPDAFPAGDLGIRRALGGLSERAAAARAEAWRPWRSYAVMYLWASLEQQRKGSP
jgi:AraC family transcriptional regulator of adaptative response / DNA-3-methyladenine glycosylase II